MNDTAPAADRLVDFDHNQPSPFIAQTMAKNDLVRAADRWLKLGKIESQEEANELSAYKAQLLGRRANVEALWGAEIAEAKRVIANAKQTWGSLYDALDQLVVQIEPKLTGWLKAERDRIERERVAAERQAQEEAERLAEIARQAEAAAARAAERGEEVDDQASTAEAMREQQAAVEEAEARARALERARPQAGGSYVAGGRKRSDGLRTVYTYRFPDLMKAVRYRVKRIADAKPLAELDDWLRKWARAEHLADKKAGRATDWERMGCVMTEDAKS